MFLYDIERKKITFQTGYKAYIIEGCWVFSITVKNQINFPINSTFLVEPSPTIVFDLFGGGDLVSYMSSALFAM